MNARQKERHPHVSYTASIHAPNGAWHVAYKGQTLPLSAWAEQTGIPYQTLYNRLVKPWGKRNRYWTPQEALTSLPNTTAYLPRPIRFPTPDELRVYTLFGKQLHTITGELSALGFGQPIVPDGTSTTLLEQNQVGLINFQTAKRGIAIPDSATLLYANPHTHDIAAELKSGKLYSTLTIEHSPKTLSSNNARLEELHAHLTHYHDLCDHWLNYPNFKEDNPLYRSRPFTSVTRIHCDYRPANTFWPTIPFDPDRVYVFSPQILGDPSPAEEHIHQHNLKGVPQNAPLHLRPRLVAFKDLMTLTNRPAQSLTYQLLINHPSPSRMLIKGVMIDVGLIVSRKDSV